MKRTISTILAAAMLAHINITPAQAADADDILGALLGLAVLGVIVHEVTDKDDGKRATTRRSNSIVHNDRAFRHGERPRRSRVLPGECLRVFEGRRAEQIVFPERCLKRNGISHARLPYRCERRIDTRRGQINVYGARCLADAGWRLPRLSRSRW
ncbi:MAG: hypothetical protein AAF566_05800 [Pseudomonadota bacterium]